MFCTKCGMELSENEKFCSKCGQPIRKNIATNCTANRGGSFLLTVVRAKQWYAINPAVKMIVDGVTEYKLNSGDTINIPISGGRHNVAFSCSIRNKIAEINVSRNMTLSIKWNRITGSIVVEEILQ